ncbi:hypothetical protein A9Q88_08015 [Gammaproteobacteria bacterium 50_400_T64]|nr:hypothetical protein A9Q88_08015 [Gammaproteobacteria bacterium 50_400_T64]
MSITTKEKAVKQIIAVFREYGYEGTSLSLLSKATGLGRSSLYHHFPKGKEDMAAAALEAVLVSFDTMVFTPLRQKKQTPFQRLNTCAKGLSLFYANGERSCLINIFSVGAAGKLFQVPLEESTLAMINMFSNLAKEAGIPGKIARHRAEELVISIQGALVLSRTLHSKSLFNRLVKELPGRFLEVD